MKQPSSELTSSQLSPRFPPKMMKRRKKKKKALLEEAYDSTPNSPIAETMKPANQEEEEHLNPDEEEEAAQVQHGFEAAPEHGSQEKNQRINPDEEEEEDSARAKENKVEVVVEEDLVKKSAAFQRVWSETDEIAILQGFRDFKEENGADPLADPSTFHDFLRKSLSIQFETKRLVDKVRKLKSKYLNSSKKKTFTPHQMIVSQLCKSIWGDIQEKEKGPGSSSEMPCIFLGKASVELGFDEVLVKEGLKVCDKDDKLEMEDKWKILYMEGLHKKLELAKEEAEMIIKALKKGK